MFSKPGVRLWTGEGGEKVGENEQKKTIFAFNIDRHCL